MILVFLFLLSAQSAHLVESVLAGAIVIPHGDFAFDSSLIPSTQSEERFYADKISIASRLAGNWFYDHLQPDIIFFSTPHGLKLDNDFAIFMGKKGQGTALIGKDVTTKEKRLYNISLEVDLAQDVAMDLLSYLHYDQHRQRSNVSGIFGFDDQRPMPLSWGEIIPLSMIFPSANNQGQGYPNQVYQKDHQRQHSEIQPSRRKHTLRLLKKHQRSPIPVVIWSNPERRYDEAPAMVPEILSLGAQIQKFIEDRPERIGVVISADLSHTHLADGPYGYSNASGLFDSAVGKWAQDPCSVNGSASLLTTCRKLQNDAKCCGFTGIVLLHGMICPAFYQVLASSKMDVGFGPAESRQDDQILYKSALLANHNVTYYGMMAATFARIQQ